jgi:RNA polymerase sigma-70 factor (ECF subfamily)
MAGKMTLTFASGPSSVESCYLAVPELRLLDDESLMDHLTSGRGDAAAILFERYQRIVFHLALRLLRSAEDAEDVVQNVFLEIIKVARRFDPERGSVRTWILQYAYHRSMDRRHQLQRYFNGRVEMDEEGSYTFSVVDAVRNFEAREVIEEAFRVIKPIERRVIKLTCFQGLSFMEIAALVGDSVGNVRHHYYRGLCKLRVFLTHVGEPKNEFCNAGMNASVQTQKRVLP